NIFVAVPAALRHHRAEAIQWDVAARMLPAALLFILVGVEASNAFDGEILKKGFGVFLLYVVVMNVQKLVNGRRRATGGDGPRRGFVPVATVGAITGFAAGLLGIGGGIITVPLLQRIVRLPLRECIATSAAVMCVTSMIGAWRKNHTLASLADAAGTPLGLDMAESVQIAACLAPTALVGGWIGAHLTHALPLRWVRAALVILLCVASAKLLGLV
ncbi:MAG: sulfite exporter TauE/SafE family protein, partial [Planctomycetota bacterium]